MVNRSASGLLGTDVAGRAEKCALARGVVFEDVSVTPCNTEIQDLRDLLVIPLDQKDVFGFEISMHDALRVRVHEGTRNVRHDAVSRFRVESAQALESRTQIFPLQILHRDEAQAVPFAVIEYINDMGATQLRRGLGFTFETQVDFCVGSQLLIDELDGTLGVQ
jgi:hypothetical protein